MEQNIIFPKFGVIRCNHVFSWVTENRTGRYIRKMSGVDRTQNSYTSGKWTGLKTVSLDEQDKFWLPWNNISSEIRHDKRLIISMPQEEPFTYKVSKVNNTSTKGVVEVTVVQDTFNSTTDYYNPETFEMYADYYHTNNVVPIAESENQSEISISLSANNHLIKIGGSSICLEASGFDGECEWKFEIDGYDTSELLFIEYKDKSCTVQFNEIEDVEELIDLVTNHKLVITCSVGKYSKSIELDIGMV